MLDLNLFHLADFDLHGPGGGSPLPITLNSTTGQGVDAAVATGNVIGGVAVFVSENAPSAGGPVPTAKVLQGGIVGTAYSETISAQGGTGPYTFAVSVGSLPAGLSLNGATGIISGTPTTVETSDFTIQVTDANSAVGSTDFEITVTAPVAGGATAYGWVN